MVTAQRELTAKAKEVYARILLLQGPIDCSQPQPSNIERRQSEIAPDTKRPAAWKQNTVSRFTVSWFRDPFYGQPALTAQHGIAVNSDI